MEKEILKKSQISTLFFNLNLMTLRISYKEISASAYVEQIRCMKIYLNTGVSSYYILHPCGVQNTNNICSVISKPVSLIVSKYTM